MPRLIAKITFREPRKLPVTGPRAPTSAGSHGSLRDQALSNRFRSVEVKDNSGRAHCTNTRVNKPIGVCSTASDTADYYRFLSQQR